MSFPVSLKIRVSLSQRLSDAYAIGVPIEAVIIPDVPNAAPDSPPPEAGRVQTPSPTPSSASSTDNNSGAMTMDSSEHTGRFSTRKASEEALAASGTTSRGQASPSTMTGESTTILRPRTSPGSDNASKGQGMSVVDRPPRRHSTLGTINEETSDTPQDQNTNASSIGGRLRTGSIDQDKSRSLLGMRGTDIPPGSAASSTGGGGSNNVNSTASTTSFLDSLSEEQRKTRTRFLPDITGFKKLYKSEIKRDLTLIKAMIKSGGSSGGIGGSGAGAVNENSDRMDVDGESVTGMESEAGGTSGIRTEDESPSDGDVSMAGTRSGANKVKVIDSHPVAFALPHNENSYICTMGIDETNPDGSQQQPQQQQPNVFTSPQVVDSITRFNPPRPPESVGPKKIHRLHRWESNPQDVEADLINYRKTVERTREELHKTENEIERIDVIGAHLRSQFMNQLKSMDIESDFLNQSVNAIQMECVKAAELLTSKTRSKGAGRAAYVMRDVMSVLKSRGDKIISADKGETDVDMMDNHDLMAQDSMNTLALSSCVSGIGGTSNDSMNTFLANGWLLPDDTVETPYGKGKIIGVYGHEKLNVKAPSPEGLYSSNNNSTTQMKDHGFQLKDTAMDGDSKEDKSITSLSTSKTIGNNKKAKEITILPPRVSVQLPFGVGFFGPEVVTSCENPSQYNDEQLIDRWAKMLDSAELMGSSIDAVTLENFIASSQTRINGAAKSSNTVSPDERAEDLDDDITEASQLPSGIDNPVHQSGTSDEKENKKHATIMNTSNVGEIPGEKCNNSDAKSGPIKTNKLLSFDSNLMKVPGLPGGSVSNLTIEQLEHSIELMLSDSKGIVSRPQNPCVPVEMQKWEKDRAQIRVLQGKVLQLENDVKRQREFRVLNERTCNYGKERRDKFEHLVSEMKDDLNSLKERLNEELGELGINKEVAEDLLTECDTEPTDYSMKRKREQDEESKSSRRKIFSGEEKML